MKDDVMTPSSHGLSAAASQRREGQFEAMRQFCRRIIREYCWGYEEPDGCDIQDTAEKYGLISPCVATAEDAERMDDIVAGDEIYRLAGWLDEPRGLSAAEGASPEAVNPNPEKEAG